MRGLVGCVYVLLALAGLGPAGCAARPAQTEDPAAYRLRKIGQAYQLAIDFRRRPPRGADELGRYFKELGEETDPAELLRSPRDGQPFVILFGADFDTAARDTVLAYEKVGADGTRHVLTLAREVRPMTSEQFARATFALGHQPTHGK